MANGKLFE